LKSSEVLYKAINETPGLVGPPMGKPTEDIVQYYHEWLDKDGFPFWPFWENILTWWQIRHLPNVKLLHFQALKDDMKGQIREIAAFLDIPIDENKWESIVEHCSFEYMKAHPEKLQKDSLWDGGNKTFFNKGTNQRWKETLSAEDSEKYEKMALEKLGPECAAWLATGKLPQ